MAKTVLVVDDDPTQRRLIQPCLSARASSPSWAEGGDAALDRLIAGAVADVVLLDLVMPGCPGSPP